jgi:hypothetical protein
LHRDRLDSMMLKEWERRWLIDMVANGPRLIQWIEYNQINIRYSQFEIMNQLDIAEYHGRPDTILSGIGVQHSDHSFAQEYHIFVTLEVYF